MICVGVHKTFIVTRQLFWSNDLFDRDVFRQQMALNNQKILTLIIQSILSDYFWSATYKPPAFDMFLKAFVISIPAHLCILKMYTTYKTPNRLVFKKRFCSLTKTLSNITLSEKKYHLICILCTSWYWGSETNMLNTNANIYYWVFGCREEKKKPCHRQRHQFTPGI